MEGKAYRASAPGPSGMVLFCQEKICEAGKEAGLALSRYSSSVWVTLLSAVILFSLLPHVVFGQRVPRVGRPELAYVSIEGFAPYVPTLRKWYVPQTLYKFYDWGGWQYTNYAKDRYRRYVDFELEGLGWYDSFGDYITKGWKIFEWSQYQPVGFGSGVFKSATYATWFDKLLIAVDSRGEYYTSLTVADQIRTTLTPLTFSKPSFNGVQWDFLSDKYAFTLLGSRISDPVPSPGLSVYSQATNFTNLIGIRGTAQVGGFLKIGVNYVNSHIGQSQLEWTENSLKGILSTSQNRGNVTMIIIRISDDSPGDESGAIFYSEQLFVDGKPSRLKAIVRGGIPEAGFLLAYGDSPIELKYVFNDPKLLYDFEYREVKKISFNLVLANDYRVDITSDLQTNVDIQPIFLLVTRAEGNVKDNSNQRNVRFDYGLPTGNDIYGFNIEVQDLMGFDLRGEYNINRQYRRFPNVNEIKHSLSSDKADAFFLNASKAFRRFYGFGEFFKIDYNYTTSVFIPDAKGFIDYENEENYKFEYVDDNDDQDRWPDWRRAYHGVLDGGVFPGLDKNNDLVSDFNQNQDLTPDYEEPFLNYNVDPPEFLFGVDMNNNTVIDRFEDDEFPDYPYKKNHKGYNFHGGVEIYPDVRLTLGGSKEWLLASDGTARSSYALFTLDKDIAKLARLEVFNCVKRVRDNIHDNIFVWVQLVGTRGGSKPFDDPMLCRNTLVNTSFLRFTYTRFPRLNVINLIKYESYDQRDSKYGLTDSHFLGVINKADYTLGLGKETWVSLRAKNLYRKKTQPTKEILDIDESAEILSLLVKFPVLTNTTVEIGAEGTLFYNRIALPEFPPPDYEDKYSAYVLGFEASNKVHYLGYMFFTNAGFRFERRFYRHLKEFDVTKTSVFLTMYASME